MEKSSNNDKVIRQAFSSISKGFSTVLIDGKTRYIKHLSHHDHISLDMMGNQFLQEALTKERLPSEKVALQDAIAEERWSNEEEKKLRDIQFNIDSLEASVKNIKTPSQSENLYKDILRNKSELYNKKEERRKIIGLTAEEYSNNRLDDYYIAESLFDDIDLKKKSFKFEDFESSYSEDFDIIKIQFNNEIKNLCDENIKLICIEDFFQVYWSMSQDNPFYFFGRSICDLTYYQIKICNYGQTYKTVLSEIQYFPDDIKGNPDKMLNYYHIIKNNKERMQKRSQRGRSNEAISIPNASKEDYKNLGISDKNTVNLSKKLAEAKNSGNKTVEMNELMKWFS